jgi:hypothetical protein
MAKYGCTRAVAEQNLPEIRTGIYRDLIQEKLLGSWCKFAEK